MIIIIIIIIIIFIILVISHSKQNISSETVYSSATYNGLVTKEAPNIGSVKEVKSLNTLEYEIYLGNELKDGQIIFEVPNVNTLHIKVIKNGDDAYGDVSLELRREIKLPNGARLNNIDHGVDARSKNLVIKVPLQN
jgi:hypothetical protein